jgi:tetratricopeptide (TPR) repeat protein
LSNLGLVYGALGRRADAELAYREALSIRRELGSARPDVYRPALARTLDNIGDFYRDATRFSDAAAAYGEALLIYRLLAGSNPSYAQNVESVIRRLARLERASRHPERPAE